MEEIKIVSSGVVYEYGRASLVVDARKDDKRIGYMRANLNIPGKCVELDTAVIPEYRGKGVVGQILDDMLLRIFVKGEMNEAAEKLGCSLATDRIVLNVNSENIAGRKSAKKLGFIKTEADSHNSVEYEMTKEQYMRKEGKKAASPEANGEGMKF